MNLRPLILKKHCVCPQTIYSFIRAEYVKDTVLPLSLFLLSFLAQERLSPGCFRPCDKPTPIYEYLHYFFSAPSSTFSLFCLFPPVSLFFYSNCHYSSVRANSPLIHITRHLYMRFFCFQRPEFFYNNMTSSNCLFVFLLGHWRDALWVGTLSVFIVLGSLIS